MVASISMEDDHMKDEEESNHEVLLPSLASSSLSSSNDSNGSYSSESDIQAAQVKSTRKGNPLVTPAKTVAITPHPSYCESKGQTHQKVFPTHSSLRKISSINSLSPSPESTKKHVAFGDLEMRKYPVILGDHPDCSSGPPLAIGWDYLEEQRIPVDKYETMKPHRRSLDELELNYFTRKRILRRFSGASDEEIRKATDEVHKVQKQRSRTKRMIPFQKVEETCESISRNIGKVVRIGKRPERLKSLPEPLPKSEPTVTPPPSPDPKHK